MKKFLEELTTIDDINHLLEKHRKFVIDNMTDFDPEVEDQKTRFQKFWCWFMYGHLTKKGKCLRCGKVINQNNIQKNGSN